MRFLLPLFALAFLLAGCGESVTEKVSERMMENAIERGMEADGRAGADVDVDLDLDGDEGAMRVTTDEGTFTAGASLPEDWPSDVPMPEDIKIGYAMAATPNGERAGKMVMFTTSASIPEMADFYKDGIEGEGWHMEGVADMGGSSMLGATKDGRKLSVMMSSDGQGVTTVSVAVEDAE